jgi:hypothetical protein
MPTLALLPTHSNLLVGRILLLKFSLGCSGWEIVYNGDIAVLEQQITEFLK